MKSTWAFNNGKRIMNEAIESQKAKVDFDFVSVRGVLRYAENKSGVLVVKTYSNKTQCLKKVDALKELGIECDMSAAWPFTILKN